MLHAKLFAPQFKSLLTRTSQLLLCFLIWMTIPGYGSDLKQTFEWAKVQDALYLSTQAVQRAETYNAPIAISALLPQFSVTANTTFTRQAPATPERYNSNGFTLTLTQSLIEFDRWKKIAQANQQSAIAELSTSFALLDLIQRTTLAYFDVLAAQDQLRFAQKNEQALQEQAHQTEQRYQVGSIAQSDLQLMLAAYAEAQAIRLYHENQVNIKKETLSKIIGQMLPDDLVELNTQFNPIIPEPQDQNSWVEIALNRSILIQQEQLKTEIENNGIWIARAGYLPSITGTIERTNTSNHKLTPQKSQTTNASVGMNLNLFSGGKTFSSVRKAQYLYQAQVAALEETRRKVSSDVRQDYLNLIADLSQIKAYEQAVISAAAAFQAAQAAYQAGTYTIVAVLQEQSRLFSSEQRYAAARYQFINDWVKLKLDSGLLNEDDIVTINQFLAVKSISG